MAIENSALIKCQAIDSHQTKLILQFVFSSCKKKIISQRMPTSLYQQKKNLKKFGYG